MRDYKVYEGETLTFARKIDEKPHPAEFELHIHDEYELYLFVSGDAEYIVEGNVYPLIQNSILLMRPGELHRVHIRSGERYERFVVTFTEELVQKIDPTLSLLRPFNDRLLGKKNLYPAHRFRGILPIELMWALAGSDFEDPNTEVRATCHLLMILSCLLDTYLAKEVSDSSSPIEHIIEYINNHLGEPLSAAGLSAHFYLSESQLNRIFKTATNLSIGRYINAKRMHLAKKLLSEGEAAGNVSYLCGFKEYSSFYRAYKKAFGISPAEDPTDRFL